MKYRLPHTSRARTYNETTIEFCNFVLMACESSKNIDILKVLINDCTYTDQCKDQGEGEGNASHERTACSLTTEGGNLGVDAYDLAEGAFHDQGVVRTCADGVV